MRHPISALAIALVVACGSNREDQPTSPSANDKVVCEADNGGITLPAGFCATIFADHVGVPRHMVVSSSGDLYVNTMNGGILALRDTNADGRSDVSARFGGASQTGLAIRGNDLFVDGGAAILRYRLSPGTLAPASGPDTIVRALPTGGHASRSVVVDGAGNLFVGVGSTGNVCEGVNRDPCADLVTRAGVFRFSADQTGQTFGAAARFATGIRNAVGLAIHPADGRLWVTQHGRDNLYQSYPAMFTAQDGAENPAEELLQVSAGDDFGWPYCYYDFKVTQRILAPEYGGNRQTVGRCASTKAAATVFPGHWAPNGLLVYASSMFPARYRNGAFIAFHGSWNRAPLPQAGYQVAFVPASGIGLSATYESFATGFAGSASITDPGSAAHRPTGLAVDSQGALYVGDDRAGRIWRIIYRQ